MRQSGNPDGDGRREGGEAAGALGTEHVLELQKPGWERPRWAQ